MRDRSTIEGDISTGVYDSNSMNQKIIIELLLDIRDAVHAVRETGGKNGSN